MRVSDSTTQALSILGAIAAWSFSGFLSLCATICTLIVAGPPAYRQLQAWYTEYAPRIIAWVGRIWYKRN